MAFEKIDRVAAVRAETIGKPLRQILAAGG